MTAEGQMNNTKNKSADKDDVLTVLKDILSSVFAVDKESYANYPPQPVPEQALSELLALKASEAGFDPIQFEQGARDALGRIERVAIIARADDAHQWGLAALDELVPRDDAHGAGIRIVKDAVQTLISR